MSCNLFSASKKRGIQGLQKSTIKPTTHVVRKGQTLSTIADMYSTDYQSIAKANGISNPNNIYIGQRLNIPDAKQTPIPPKKLQPKPPSTKKPVPDDMGIDSKGSGCECPPAKWMNVAKREIGVKEIKGKKGSNPRVEKYHDAAGLEWARDDVPWCASFVDWVMNNSGYGKTVSHPYRAKSWKNYGKKAKKPIYGAIAIKSRRGGGHVAFVVGQSKDGKYLYVLGGNQSDAVNIKRYPRSVWTDFRVPDDYDDSKCKLPIYGGSATKGGKES